MLKFLAHPLTRNLDVDDPKTTDLRREIIKAKPFLKAIYEDWYSAIVSSLPPVEGPVLEIGSGAGFLQEFIPGLITSEVFRCGNARVVLDGTRLPFRDGSLRAIVMTDVLHHIPDCRAFFNETQRCLQVGGGLIMIEPWVSEWSSVIYKTFHHEPFVPETESWGFPSSGPLSGANGALPWIVFQRDRSLFEREFPRLRIVRLQPMTPFRYLVSGGVSMRSLMPGAATRLWKTIEALMTPWMHYWAMFAIIRIERT
jgi:SAM-dependent methyltransferase